MEILDRVQWPATEARAMRKRAWGPRPEGGMALGIGGFAWLVAMLLACVVAVKASMATGETPCPVQVPPEFRALYDELSSKLSSLRRRLTGMWDGEKGKTAFGVELLVANSNRGELLLGDRVSKATALTLGRLKELGVRAIALSIQYPMLVGDSPQSAEYMDFYRRVVQEAKAHGYVVIVEMGTFFPEPQFTRYRVNYKGLTLERFRTGLREMAERIVEGLRPDYLTILSEPDTAARNTGVDLAVSSFAAVIRHVAAGLDHPGVRLGAGAGTWSAKGYFTALADIPELDYLDLHIYPVHRDYVLDKVTEIAALARSRGKGVAVGEAWLYKVSERELGRISPLDAFTRDVYSFWNPLDAAFLDLIVALCHHIGAEFCSFFWMKYLYGYLQYDHSTKALRPQELINKIDALAGQRMLSGSPSETGLRFKALCGSK